MFRNTRQKQPSLSLKRPLHDPSGVDNSSDTNLDLFNIPPPPPPSGTPLEKGKYRQNDTYLIHDGYGDIELDSRYLNASALSSSNDVEWTPADSSYGAAIPVCGWIPKNIRRIIELCLLTILVASFVAGIVKLIELTIFRPSSSSSSNSTQTTTKTTKFVNDDFYLEYDSKTDSSSSTYDDDLFSQLYNTSYYNNSDGD